MNKCGIKERYFETRFIASKFMDMNKNIPQYISCMWAPVLPIFAFVNAALSLLCTDKSNVTNQLQLHAASHLDWHYLTPLLDSLQLNEQDEHIAMNDSMFTLQILLSRA